MLQHYNVIYKFIYKVVKENDSWKALREAFPLKEDNRRSHADVVLMSYSMDSIALSKKQIVDKDGKLSQLYLFPPICFLLQLICSMIPQSIKVELWLGA